MSRLSEASGLKYPCITLNIIAFKSRLSEASGLKLFLQNDRHAAERVSPLRGEWIEIIFTKRPARCRAGLASQRRVD